jgi:hypothetical protein
MKPEPQYNGSEEDIVDIYEGNYEND